MAWRYDTWESYFYPETINPVTGTGTLRNLFDERDARVLARFEYVETTGRATELLTGRIQVPRTYDAVHIRAIHRHLFQDVYEWAGEYRRVNISKNVSDFADVHTGEVDRYLADARLLVLGTEWGRLNHDAFTASSAQVFAYVNQAHPFREGNGRTAKVFMEHVAEQSQFTFDYGRVSPEVWNQASMLSGPDRGRYEPEPAEFVPVFHAITIERRSDPSARGA